MDRGLDNILMRYADKIKENGELCFVAGESTKKKDTYVIYKYANGEDSITNLLDKELPQNAGVDSVLRMENGKYVLDEIATRDIADNLDYEIEEVDFPKKLLNEVNIFKYENGEYKVNN